LGLSHIRRDIFGSTSNAAVPNADDVGQKKCRNTLVSGEPQQYCPRVYPLGSPAEEVKVNSEGKEIFPPPVS